MQPASSGHWAREKAWEQLCTKSYMVMPKNLNIDVSKDSPIDRLITISANIKMVSLAGWHLCFNWKHNLSNSNKTQTICTCMARTCVWSSTHLIKHFSSCSKCKWNNAHGFTCWNIPVRQLVWYLYILMNMCGCSLWRCQEPPTWVDSSYMNSQFSHMFSLALLRRIWF